MAAMVYNTPIMFFKSAKKTIAACLLLFTVSATANSVAEYQARKDAYIQRWANTGFEDSLVMQAYLGLALDKASLSKVLDNLQTNHKTDFGINKLVRILFLTQDSQANILDALQGIDYWLTKGECKHQYWSENHMILWNSSAWLLHESFGFELSDPMLRERLVHILKMKVKYGFYEFFSPTYFPYTLAGLLNLADFAQDREIKTLATQAAEKLLVDMMLLVNNQGAFYPAAARAYFNKYTSAYAQNHAGLIQLLLGLGHAPSHPTQAGILIATSNFDMSKVIEAYTKHTDTVYKNGHPLSKNIHQAMTRFDKTLLQWSSGAYFHPDVIDDTLWMIQTMDLWQHEAFKIYFVGHLYAPWLAKAIAMQMLSFTQSSVISEAKIAIYKHEDVVLSSIQNFWPGSRGYQQWPWVAAVGDVAVWTQSGKVYEDWNSRSKQHANASLPYIQQAHNAALIMYKANDDLVALEKPDNSISLFWPGKLDESISYGHWLFGRRGDAYIAVYRPCTKTINGVYACDNQDGQTWAVIVGHHATDGAFSSFKDEVLKSAYVKDAWVWNWQRMAYDYTAEFNYKNIKLKKSWH